MNEDEIQEAEKIRVCKAWIIHSSNSISRVAMI
jgi:hypothetical protein